MECHETCERLERHGAAYLVFQGYEQYSHVRLVPIQLEKWYWRPINYHRLYPRSEAFASAWEAQADAEKTYRASGLRNTADVNLASAVW